MKKRKDLRFKTLAGLRSNLRKLSQTQDAPAFGWRSNDGWYWVDSRLPDGWVNPYWTSRKVGEGKDAFWDIYGVYGEGAESPDDGVPEWADAPPLAQRVFA